MSSEEFFEQLDASIAKYDLLTHPFYRSWGAGKLSRKDLHDYARDYYPHVEAFPSYLAAFGLRLPEGELRRAVLSNMCDETGQDPTGGHGRSHAELWLDFAEGIGARYTRGYQPIADVKALINHYSRVACEGAPEEALAAFYAYESRVPRLAKEKARGLREKYDADERTCEYFRLHATADVQHSQVWRSHLGKLVEGNPEAAQRALAAGEEAAKALWQVLDGIEAQRSVGAAA